jgi:hypothetical protein
LRVGHKELKSGVKNIKFEKICHSFIFTSDLTYVSLIVVD